MKKILIILFVCSCFLANAQTPLGRETLYNFTQGSFNYNYLVYYPADYFTTTKKYPVVFFFYGLGHDPIDGKGNKNPTSILLNQGLADQIENNNFSPSFLCVSIQTPLYNGNQPNGWNYGNPSQVDIVLSHIIPTLRIDLSKMVPTGLSAGGQAIMLYNANKNYSPKYRFAAIVPMSAAVDTTELNLKRIADSNLHVWGFGSDPGDVYGTITHRIVNNINKLKPGLAFFTNIRGGTVGHCCWQDEYNASSGLYEWIAKYSVTGVDTTTHPIDTTHQDTTVITTQNPNWIYPTKRADNSISLTAYNLKAGDSVAIPDNISYVSWVGFKGDSLNKVVLFPENAQSHLQTFNFVGCTGFKITSLTSRYGFIISSPTKSGAALSFTGRTANFEIDSVQVLNVGVGIWCKIETSDDNNSDSLRYPNWWLHDIYVHDNDFEHITLEGGYIGSTNPNGLKAYPPAPRGVTYWNGIADSSMPPRLYNIRFINNRYRDIGRAAIQVSAAELGYNEISNNDIDSVGSDPDKNQGNGISAGSYYHGKIINNKIRHTKKDAIQSTASDVEISENDIDYAGTDGMGHTSIAGAIYIVSQKNAYPTNTGDTVTKFIITDNDFGSNNSRKDTGLFVETGYGTYSNENVLSENTGGYFIRPGINYSTDIDTTGDPIDSLVIGALVTIYKADGTSISPENWQQIRINKRGNYVIIYADGSKQYFKKDVQ